MVFAWEESFFDKKNINPFDRVQNFTTFLFVDRLTAVKCFEN